MRKYSLLTCVLAALLAGFVFSCLNPVFNKPAAKPGTVTIRLAGDSARTLMPDTAPEFTSYSLSFTPLSGQAAIADIEGIEPDELTGEGVPIALLPGSWKITATGYVTIPPGIAGIEAGQYPAARGSVQHIVNLGDANVELEITINHIDGEGEGILDYSVTLPAYATAATLNVLKITDGTAISPPVNINLRNTAGSNTFADNVATGAQGINAGYYILQITVTGGTADGRPDVTVKSDTLHIYSGMTTSVQMTEDFEIIKSDVVVLTFYRNLGYFPVETNAFGAAVRTVPIGQPVAANGFPAVERPGFTLDGWYPNAEGTGDAFVPETTPTRADAILYAKWTWAGPRMLWYEADDNGNFVGTPYTLTGTPTSNHTPTVPPSFVTAGTPHNAVLSGAVVKEENGRKVVEITDPNGYIEVSEVAGAAFNRNNAAVEMYIYTPNADRRDAFSAYRDPESREKTAGSMWIDSDNYNLTIKVGTAEPVQVLGTSTVGRWSHVIMSRTGNWGNVWVNGRRYGDANVFSALGGEGLSPFLQSYFGDKLLGGKFYRIILHDTDNGTNSQQNMDNHATNVNGISLTWSRTNIRDTLNTLNSVEVNFNPNGGNWGGNEAVQTITRDGGHALEGANPTTGVSAGTTGLGRAIGTANFPANPEKSGFVFVQWNTQADGNGDTVTTNTLVTSPKLTCYAIWSDKARVYFMDGPVSNSGATQVPRYTLDVDIGGSFGANLPAPTLAGYDFAGWWTQPRTGGTQLEDSTPVSVAMTVYSRWTLNTDVRQLIFEVDGNNNFTGTFYDENNVSLGTVTAQMLGATPPTVVTTVGYPYLKAVSLGGNGGYVNLGREAAMLLNNPTWVLEVYANIPTTAQDDHHLISAVQHDTDQTKGVIWADTANNIRLRKRTGYNPAVGEDNIANLNGGKTGNWEVLAYLRHSNNWMDAILNANTTANRQMGADLSGNDNLNPLNFFFLGRRADGAVVTVDVRYHKIVLRSSVPSTVGDYNTGFGPAATATRTQLNAVPPTAEQEVDQAIAAVTAQLGGTTLTRSNGDDMQLPTVWGAYDGVSISWSSSPPGVVSNTGVVAWTDPDETIVTLTGTFSRDTVSKEQTFTITVFASAEIREANDQVNRAIKKAEVALGDLSTVDANITLPASYTFDGVTINVVWESDNTSALSNSGAVTRPPAPANAPAALTLTGTFTHGTYPVVSKEKVWNVRVMHTGAIMTDYLNFHLGVVDVGGTKTLKNLAASGDYYEPTMMSGASIDSSVAGYDVINVGNSYIDLGPKVGSLLRKPEWTIEFYIYAQTNQGTMLAFSNDNPISDTTNSPWRGVVTLANPAIQFRAYNHGRASHGDNTDNSNIVSAGGSAGLTNFTGNVSGNNGAQWAHIMVIKSGQYIGIFRNWGMAMDNGRDRNFNRINTSPDFGAADDETFPLQFAFLGKSPFTASGIGTDAAQMANARFYNLKIYSKPWATLTGASGVTLSDPYSNPTRTQAELRAAKAVINTAWGRPNTN